LVIYALITLRLTSMIMKDIVSSYTKRTSLSGPMTYFSSFGNVNQVLTLIYFNWIVWNKNRGLFYVYKTTFTFYKKESEPKIRSASCTKWVNENTCNCFWELHGSRRINLYTKLILTGSNCDLHTSLGPFDTVRLYSQYETL
jgi:hypothetical protein